MVCPNCKSENVDGSKFCNGCGKILEAPKPQNGEKGFWDKYLPLFGAALGLVSGLITISGWFSPFTSLSFGNGPQLVALPFGLSQIGQSLNGSPILAMIFESANEITGWVLLISIALSLISIALVLMSLMSIWSGVICLENRSDVTDLPLVKSEIKKLRNYSLTGIIFVIILMVFVSFAQVGKSTIGGGLMTMAFGYIATFLIVVYLKPHLR
jgi:hypothetical protein